MKLIELMDLKTFEIKDRVEVKGMKGKGSIQRIIGQNARVLMDNSGARVEVPLANLKKVMKSEFHGKFA